MKKLSWISEQNYQVLTEHLQDGIFVIEDEKFTYANQRLSEMFGYPVDELIGRPFIDFVADESKSVVSERHRARIAGESVPELYDILVSTAQGTTICCSLNVGLSESPTGQTVAVGSVRDVTEQRAAQMELKNILDQLPDVFYRTNMQGIITMISASCFDNIGYRQDEMLGTALSGYYYAPEDRQKMVQAITNGGGKATQVEAALKHKNGSIIWVSTNAKICFGLDGQASHIEGVARDITERKRMEDQLVTLSRTDGMTGAYSRSYFMDKAEEVINIVKRYQRPASIMIADLDHFKTINDKYGHHAGDVALKAFTEVCRQEMRESDMLGRLGGEEFGLVLPETTIQEAQVLAERIRMATAALEIKLDEGTVGITVSIGLVEISSETVSLDAVMRRADQAMYQGKAEGRNKVVAAKPPKGSALDCVVSGH